MTVNLCKRDSCLIGRVTESLTVSDPCVTPPRHRRRAEVIGQRLSALFCSHLKTISASVRPSVQTQTHSFCHLILRIILICSGKMGLHYLCALSSWNMQKCLILSI